MKAIKRTVAALLATLMLATSTSFTLAAEEYSDAEAVAVAKVNAASIMTGTDKGFEPSKTLTRAEAAAIMVRMKGISESTVKQSAGTTLFSDVPASHWAAGYVNVASNYGLIVGVGAGLFAPDKEVSVAEFYTMAVRALGAGKLVDSEGTWPTNYVNFAIENDLAEDVAQVYSATATRISAAIIAANTLEASMWEKSAVKSNGEITWEAKTKKIVTDVLKLQAYANAADKANKKSTTVKVSTASNKDHTITPFTGTALKAVDTLDLSNIKSGMTYEYWMNDKDKVVGLWLPKSSEAIEFTEIKKYKDVASGKDEITLIVDGREEVYKIDDETVANLPTVVNNEVTETVSDALLFTAGTAGTPDTGLLIPRKNIRGTAYLTEDVISQIYMTEFTNVAVVDEASEKKVTVKSGSDYVGTTLSTSAISLTVKDKEYFLTKNGEAMSFSDLNEDDIIRFYEVVGGNKIVAEVVEAAASGKITSTKSGSIKIDGKSYDLDSSVTGLAVKDEVTIYLNDAGKVILAVKDEEATPDYGYVAYAREVSGKYEDTVEVKLLLPNGELTEAMEIDVDESTEEDASFDIADIQLGIMMHYELTKDNKVIVKNVADPEFEEVTTSNDAIILDVTNKNIKIVDVTTGTPDTLVTKYYITKDTKVLKLKADKTYAYKFEEIDVEDLDDLTFDETTASFVGGIDDDTKEVKVLYISADTAVKRTTEANFTFITKVWDEEDADEKAVKVIDVILQDGSTDTFTVNKDTTGAGSNYANVVAGTYWDMAAKDGIVLEMKKNTTVPGDDYLATFNVTTNKYLFKQLTSSRYQLTATGASAAAGELLVADDVLVLKANKASGADKWTVAQLSDIETYETAAELTNDTTVDTLISVLTYVEEAGDEAEAKLIIYYVDEK